MTDEKSSYLWCVSCGEKDEKHWSIIHWRISLHLTDEKCDRCGKALAPDGPARVEVVNYSGRVFPTESPALLRKLRGDMERHALLDVEAWRYALKPKHSKAIVDALSRSDQLERTLDEVKAGYAALNANWHTLHEAFTSAIRKALDLPDADIRELVERIEDLKAAEREVQLHVFHNDCDWVVAYSVDDAWRVLTGTTGEEREERGGFDEMVQLPDDQVLPVMMHTDVRGPDIEGLEVEELGEREHFQIRVKTTCGDWCKRNGRGFLCSTEF